MKQKYALLVLILLFSLKGISQSYSVTPVPFQQYTGSLVPLSTFDDFHSPLISLPFSFNYYGVSYNQVVISTNGYIDFRVSSASTTSPWVLTNNMTIPSPTFSVKNAILGAFHDMNNSNAQGTISYGISGNAPYRKFVVFYDNNSHFGSCSSFKSTFQMILNETTNIIDVQLIEKQLCASWNNGNCVTGLINLAGDQGIAAPNRNTSSWSAFQEGWRFKPTTTSTSYNFIKCDTNLDGFEDFNLAVVQNDLNVNLAYYPTLADATAMTNAITTTSYTNVTPNTQTIYATVLGTTQVLEINLSMVDCTIDFDSDTVPTDTEDINADTNLANDDTDADTLANFNDNDDDGDLVLTNVEYVFARSVLNLQDSDNDGILNYIDNDDDGDGILTINEDANNNNNPMDDDADGDGIPNFLENSSLSNQDFTTQNNISIYPNPASNILNIENKTQETITNISIYSIKGDLVMQSKSNTIAVSDLQNGVYFVKIELNKTVLNYKFVKN